MFMRFVGMGIGHQDGGANTNISDDMDCDPDACEEFEEYHDGDDEIRPGQGPNDDVLGEGEDEEDIEDEEEDEEDDQDDQDNELSEDDIGYDNL